MVGSVGEVNAEDLSAVTTKDIFRSLATVRCIGVGNRQSFLEMNKIIEGKNIKPVLDKTVFNFGDLKAAYQYMVRIPHMQLFFTDPGRKIRAI